MGFPPTSETCRFAMRGGQMTLEDAEDVAAQTFATLV